MERLKADGVDCRHVLKSKKNSTGVAFVTYFEDGSRKYIFHMGNTPAVEAEAPAKDEIPEAKFFHIMGCSLMANSDFAEEILKTMKIFRSKGAKVSFDPNVRPELFTPESMKAIREVLKTCSIYLPGAEELLAISGEKTVENAVKKCFENPVLEILVLKNGSKGSVIYTREEEIQVGIYKVEAKDATGAGDSFDGAFLCGLLEGRSLLEAGQMAAAAASINTAAFGPMEGKITKETVRKMMNQ